MKLHELIEHAKYHAIRLRKAWQGEAVAKKLQEAVSLAEAFPQGEALVDAVLKDANKFRSVLHKLDNAIAEGENLLKEGVKYEADDHAPDKH